MLIPITYEQILPFWHRLQPNHPNMRPTTCMRFLGGYDAAIHDYPATFFGCMADDKIVAVFAGHKTGPGIYRTRGMFVEPAYRGRGLTHQLFNAVEQQARDEDCPALWSTPRQSSLPIWLRHGFVQVTDWITEGFVDGPNCYVVKRVLL